MSQLLIFSPLPKTIYLARGQRVSHASLWDPLHIKTITGRQWLRVMIILLGEYFRSCFQKELPGNK